MAGQCPVDMFRFEILHRKQDIETKMHLVHLTNQIALHFYYY